MTSVCRLNGSVGLVSALINAHSDRRRQKYGVVLASNEFACANSA